MADINRVIEILKAEIAEKTLTIAIMTAELEAAQAELARRDAEELSKVAAKDLPEPLDKQQ